MLIGFFCLGKAELSSEKRCPFKRGLRKVFCPWPSVHNVLMFLTAVFFLSLIDMDKGQWASWVQAVGSIGTIAGAFAIANWQARKQQTHLDRQSLDRIKAMHAVLESAVDHARSMGDFAKSREPDFAFIAFWNIGLGGPFKAAVNALKAIPVHELGDAASVVQFMAIVGAMTQMQAEIENYLSEKPSMERTLHTYEMVDVYANTVAYSWSKFAEHVGLNISSPGSC